MRAGFFYLFLLPVLFLTSCTKEESTLQEEFGQGEPEGEILDGIQVESDRIEFSSKTESNNFINSKTEDDFQNLSLSLRKVGFRSLTPIFKESETKERRAF